MKAQASAPCAYDRCTHGRVIGLGDDITWSRKTGERYHVDCFEAWKRVRGYESANSAEVQDDDSDVPQTVKERVIKNAIQVLRKHPSGARSAEVAQQVMRLLPREVENSIRTIIGILPTYRPEEVYKPVRGQLRLIEFRETAPNGGRRGEVLVSPAKRRLEQEFYKPFASYLVDELEECTKAFPVGGNTFKSKWGTPDVIGVLESRRADVISFPTEVVSAEIKIDTASLITAFGQACAYKLFSHRTYIVVPKDAPKEDIDRLDALCMIFGIGFILFDSANVTLPKFEIKVRAAKHEPDRFYVNENMKLIQDWW